MSVGEALLGLDGALYINDGGSFDTPAWREILNVKDIQMGATTGKADVSNRGTGKFRASEPTLSEGPISFGMVDDGGDDVSFFEDRWFDRALIDVMYLNQKRDIVGAKGWRMQMKCFECSGTQNLEEGQMKNVVIEPCYSSHPPERIRIT